MQFKKILTSYNYLVFYSLLIFISNLFFLNIPLINVFGYEFAIANSILLTILSGLFFISFFKKKDIIGKGDLKKLLIPIFVFLSIPLIVTLINSILTEFCSFPDGVLFYLIITCPSVIIGGALGLISTINIKRFPRVFFLFLLFIILLIPLTEFYLNPQVYFYNPILGYLSGTIYDEGLTVDFKLFSYRLLNVIFFGGILIYLLLSYIKKFKVNKIFLNIIIIVIPAGFIYLSPLIGYSTTFSSLEDELHKKISTENFEIYFSPDISEDEIKLIIVHHEYYYNELKEFLQVKPVSKIKSYVFQNRQQKRKLFGSANADIAKIWLYSIFITKDAYSSTLRHEIAHCFSAEFGVGPFKVADGINPYLIEGIATASHPFYDDYSIHYMAAIAYKNGFRVGLDRMFGFTNFFTQLSTLSYIYAGSFTKYLIDSYGIEKYKRLYADLNFAKVYQTSTDSLLKNWQNFIELFETEGTEHIANFYFGRKSIFHKTCPRYISDRLERAWIYYNSKEFEKAEKIFNSVLEKEMNYSALTGLSLCYFETDKLNESIKLLEENINAFESTSYYYNLQLNLADLYIGNNNLSDAEFLYSKINKQKPGTRLYYISELRITLIENDDMIYHYLKGSDYDKYQVLKELNKKTIHFESIPVMINLSRVLEEEYEVFIKQFDKTIYVTDFSSSYAVYSLSKYMLENLDFIKARKMAALAMRYNDNKSFNEVYKENFKRMNWIYHNADSIFTNENN